jgi:tRNA(Ile)-lysidine synthase
MIMSLESFMQQALSHQPIKGRLLVAYSGGLDSTVLLYLMAQAKRELKLSASIIAVHVNHQLSVDANRWERHCESVCGRLQIDYRSARVDINKNGKGLEAAAREARYKVFEAFIEPKDILLMAHHRNDQAETFLLRLMRGAGVLGLSAMPVERALGTGQIWRPLLNVSRDELEAYANKNKLQWVEDDSNVSLNFDRNFLRHKIIPTLLSRWPHAIKQLQSTTARLEETQQLLNDLAAIDFQDLDERAERYGYSIDYHRCALLSAGRIANLMRYWCQQKGLMKPNRNQLLQIQTQFFGAGVHLSSALVAWGACECRLFNNRFYLMPSLPSFSAATRQITVGEDHKVNLGEAGELVFNDVMIKTQNISIRWRQGGERCRPIDRQHSQTVKKLLQEHHLETWLRDRVPLVYCDEQLVAVADLWLCEEIANHVNIENKQELAGSPSKGAAAQQLSAKNLLVWSL